MLAIEEGEAVAQNGVGIRGMAGGERQGGHFHAALGDENVVAGFVGSFNGVVELAVGIVEIGLCETHAAQPREGIGGVQLVAGFAMPISRSISSACS